METWGSRNLFVSPLYYTLVANIKQLNKELDRLEVSRDRISFPKYVGHAECNFLYNKTTGKEICIVCINTGKSPDPNEICGLLVHEASHIQDYVFKLIGEKKPSEEFKAYTIQAISQELFKIYSVRTKSKNKG